MYERVIIVIRLTADDLLFPFLQLPHLPHKQPGAGLGVGIFYKLLMLFPKSPGDGFGQANIQGFMFIIANSSAK